MRIDSLEVHIDADREAVLLVLLSRLYEPSIGMCLHVVAAREAKKKSLLGRAKVAEGARYIREDIVSRVKEEEEA